MSDSKKTKNVLDEFKLELDFDLEESIFDLDLDESVFDFDLDESVFDLDFDLDFED